MDTGQHVCVLFTKQLGLLLIKSAVAVAASRTSCLLVCAVMLSQMLQGHHSMLDTTCKA